MHRVHRGEQTYLRNKSKLSSYISLLIYFKNRDFTNHEIEDDQDDPKEPSHFDYKYLKSPAGPLYKSRNAEGTTGEDTSPLMNN